MGSLEGPPQRETEGSEDFQVSQLILCLLYLYGIEHSVNQNTLMPSSNISLPRCMTRWKETGSETA